MIATLSRGDTSVTIPLVSDTSGTPVVVRGLGKPALSIKNTGSLDPRFSDQFSGQEQYTLSGRFVGASAHQDAIQLADIIKSTILEEPIILNIDSPEFDSNITVAPGGGQQGPLKLNYEPGTKNVVGVDLALTRVGFIEVESTQIANTPTGSGNGPIELSRDGTTVTLTKDIAVERTVGRPNSVIRASVLKDPKYIDKAKSAFDQFELRAQFTQNAVSTINELVDMFRPKLRGLRGIGLNFNGLYGMGEMRVVPFGSEAIRFTRNAGQRGISVTPKITLRRVFSP